MSETVVYVLPTNENYLPQTNEFELINRLIKNNQLIHRFEIENNEYIRLYDCGENFEKIICPFCKEEMPIEWWQEEMSNAYKSEFSDLKLITPCCNKATSLNRLNYYFSQGFAKFAIKFEGYENDKFLYEKEFISKLHDISGVDWKVILSRY